MEGRQGVAHQPTQRRGLRQRRRGRRDQHAQGRGGVQAIRQRLEVLSGTGTGGLEGRGGGGGGRGGGRGERDAVEAPETGAVEAAGGDHGGQSGPRVSVSGGHSVAVADD